MLNNLSAWPSIGPNFYTEDIKQQDWPKDFIFSRQANRTIGDVSKCGQ